MTESSVVYIYSNQRSYVYELVLTFLVCIVEICGLGGNFVIGYCLWKYYALEVQNEAGKTYLCIGGVLEFILGSMIVPSLATGLHLGGVHLCHLVHVVTTTIVYSTTILTMFACCEAIKNKIGIFYNVIYTPGRACGFGFLVLLITLITSSIGVAFDLDFDYCNRGHQGNLYFVIITNLIFYVFPSCLIIFCLTFSAIINKKVKNKFVFIRDIVIYIIYFLTWIPTLIIMYLFPGADDEALAITLLLGLARSSLSFILYTKNNNFKSATGLRFTVPEIRVTPEDISDTRI